MVSKKEEYITVSNNDAVELRNSINAYVMVCGYTGEQEISAYVPKKILLANGKGIVDFDIFISVKACMKNANSTIRVKLASAEGQIENKLVSTQVSEFSIAQLYEHNPENIIQDRLPYDPYEFKGLMSIGMKDITFLKEGKYVAIVDTKTTKGENVLLDACYFDVKFKNK